MKSPLFILPVFLLGMGATSAATIDAKLIPDTTYTAKIEKIMDPKHMLVKFDSTGMESVLSSNRANVDFSKFTTGQDVRLSLGSGLVLVIAKN